MKPKITIFLPYMSNGYHFFKMKEISFLSIICTSLKSNNIKFQVLNPNERNTNHQLNNTISLTEMLTNKKDVLIKYLEGEENFYLKQAFHKIIHKLKSSNLSEDFFLYYQPTFDEDVHIYLCILKELKSFFKDLKIICSGLYFSKNPLQIMKQYNFIDYILDYYSHNSITEVIKAIDNSKIKSITYRSGESIKKNPIGEIDFNTLVMPNHYLLTKDLNVVPVLYCVGCLFKCFFCDYLLANQRFKLRNIDMLLEEINFYYKRGVRYFWIEGAAVNLQQNHLIKFCEAIIKNHINIKWSAPLIPYKIDKSIFNIMNKAGCVHLRIGIETTNENILKKFKKGINLESITATLRESSEANIKNTLTFMIGLPFEKKSDNIRKMFFVKRNIKYINSIRTFIFELRRNTEILKHPNKFSLEPIDDTSNARYLKFNKLGGPPWEEINKEQLFLQTQLVQYLDKNKILHVFPEEYFMNLIKIPFSKSKT